MFDARVLLVDDEVAFVTAMSKRLTKRDLHVTTAFSGSEGIEILEKDSNIDVVILDVKMPGMDGLQTLQAIRNRFPLVEVVMLTGYSTVEWAINAMKIGAFDYLLKPCEIDLLMTKILEAKARKAKHEEKIISARMKQIAMRKPS
ncbi:MAG TPA: response regulator [Desulfomonilaceae bacterium]|nr:response regulator [Desulfomonilaceae bacterium]